MRELQLYIQGQRVDLFDDEDVSLTQTIQNVKDIGKVFTDFSKPFTVPASKRNNQIFEHYYNFNISDGFDARAKVPATIELNDIPFNSGKIKLEGVDLKSGKPYAYRVTYYGNTVNLKDVLGEDTLNGLSWLAGFERTYTSANVLADLQVTGVTLTNDSVSYTDAFCMPLITTNTRLFWDSAGTYAPYFETDGTINDDLRRGNVYYDAAEFKGVYYEELKYAIRVYLIIKAIEESYEGITFSADSFFKDTSNAQFYELYMWMHREKGFAFTADEVTNKYVSFPSDSVAMSRVISTPGSLTVFNLQGSETITYNLIVATAPAADYSIVIYRNGSIYQQGSFAGGTSGTALSGLMVNGNYEVFVTGTATQTIALSWIISDPTLGQSNTYVGGSQQLTATPVWNAQQQMPDIKVIDFLTGLFKMFNLTAFVNQAGEIVVKTLDSYYQSGIIRDITKYVDAEEHSVDSVLPFKEIKFEYEGRGTKLAQLYEQEQGKGWGTEDFRLENDILGEVYSISVPFEHMHYDTIPSGHQVGYCIDDNEDPYIGEPVVFYRNVISTVTPISFLSSNASVTSITDTCSPSNSVSLSAVTDDDTCHFSVEINEYSSIGNFDGSLFANYYQTYIQDVFNSRRRLTKLKACLPTDFLIKYSLADTLQIGDRFYTINAIDTNLKTGVSNLELLNVVGEVIDPTTTTTTSTTTAPPTTTTSSTTTSSTTTTSTTTTSTTTTSTTTSSTTTTTAPPTTTTTTTTLQTYYLFNACDGGTTVIDVLGTPPSQTGQRYVDFSVTPEEYYTYTGFTQQGSGGYPVVDLQAVTPTVTGCPTTTTTTTTQAYQSILLYEQSGGGGWGSANDACLGSGSILVKYISINESIAINVVVYNDTNLSIPFAGNNTWYQDQGSTNVINIAANGVINSIADCSTTTTTTTTTAPPPQSWFSERSDEVTGYIAIAQGYDTNDEVLVNDGSGLCWTIGELSVTTPQYSITGACPPPTTTTTTTTTTAAVCNEVDISNQTYSTLSQACSGSPTVNIDRTDGTPSNPQVGDIVYEDAICSILKAPGIYQNITAGAAIEIGGGGLITDVQFC
jgi:hypothetical protein